MRHLFYIAINILLLLTSCQKNNSEEFVFDYDPSIPYPVLNPGEFWLDRFDQRGLQHAVIWRDKIYCNTIDVAGNGNFLYCLNPVNGLVEWRAPVEAFAAQPAVVCDENVVYCSYLGDLSIFDMEGKRIWKAKFDHPYGGHWVDTIRSQLLVKTVYWKDVSVYDIKSGDLISNAENDSLQELIASKIKNDLPLETHTYRLERMGTTYIINCGPDTIGNYKIDIN